MPFRKKEIQTRKRTSISHLSGNQQVPTPLAVSSQAGPPGEDSPTHSGGGGLPHRRRREKLTWSSPAWWDCSPGAHPRERATGGPGTLLNSAQAHPLPWSGRRSSGSDRRAAFVPGTAGGGAGPGVRGWRSLESVACAHQAPRHKVQPGTRGGSAALGPTSAPRAPAAAGKRPRSSPGAGPGLRRDAEAHEPRATATIRGPPTLQ